MSNQWKCFLLREFSIFESCGGRYERIYLCYFKTKARIKEAAAAWSHDKWEVPQEAYLECMEAYLNHETEYGWYLCLDKPHFRRKRGE